MPDPIASVIIPTHDRDCDMAKAVNSALSQSLDDIEVIVIDDACKDQTLEILGIFEKYDPRLRVLSLHAALGISGGLQRNEGVKVARGKYICYLDDDDEMTYRSVEMRVNFLETHAELDYCWGSSLFLRNGGAGKDWAHVCMERLVAVPEVGEGIHWSIGTVIPDELMHRAGVVGDSGIWWTAGRGEDQRLLTAIVNKGFKGAPVDYPVAIYGRHTPHQPGNGHKAAYARLEADRRRRLDAAGMSEKKRPVVAPTRMPDDTSEKIQDRSQRGRRKRSGEVWKTKKQGVDVPEVRDAGDAAEVRQGDRPERQDV